VGSNPNITLKLDKKDGPIDDRKTNVNNDSQMGQVTQKNFKKLFK